MAQLSLCPQFETNLISNPKVIGALLQLKSAKAHGKNYIKIVPLLGLYDNGSPYICVILSRLKVIFILTSKFYQTEYYLSDKKLIRHNSKTIAFPWRRLFR